MTKVLDILSDSQLFGGLSEAHLKEIKRIAVDKKFNKGEIIFLTGMKETVFFLL